MNMSISNRCGRNQCSIHNCCRHYERPPYPPVPTPPKPMYTTIPITPLNGVPDAANVPPGSLVLIGDPLPTIMDPDSMPNPQNYYFAVANGCYYMGFSPSMLGCPNGNGTGTII